MCLIIPEQYKSSLGVIQTQQAIKELKDYFEQRLSEELKLTRVSSPLFVLPETGTNDNLNGVEKAVNFNVPNINKNVEIVQSLAKWKRVALKKYGFETGRGIYTDMNAIRKDEELDNIHSIYVDILFYNPVLDNAIELSSMGIRVDEESLKYQLDVANCNDRKELDYHKSLLNGELPYTIGGGIGQSRICMYFLNKAHIGEVQVGVWPDDMIRKCSQSGIHLL